VILNPQPGSEAKDLKFMANEPQTNPLPVTASQLTQALEGFSSQIDEKFVNFEKRIVTRLEKKVDTAVETLAQQTALGFADMEERFQKQDETLENLALAIGDDFADMGERFEEVNHNIAGLKGDVRRIDIRFTRQQEIVDEHDIVRRVAKLEQKVGLK
jgi:hypothetical protein